MRRGCSPCPDGPERTARPAGGTQAVPLRTVARRASRRSCGEPTAWCARRASVPRRCWAPCRRRTRTSSRCWTRASPRPLTRASSRPLDSDTRHERARPRRRRLVRRSPMPNCERCSDTAGRAAASWTSAPRPQELRRVRKNLLPSDDGPVTLTVATTGPGAPGIDSAHSCGLPGDRDDDAGIRCAGGSTTDPDDRDHHRPRYRHRNLPQRAVCSPRCASRSQPTGRTRRTRSPHWARGRCYEIIEGARGIGPSGWAKWPIRSRSRQAT